MPRIKWNGNYWDDWNLRLPRSIIGEKVLMLVLRPGYELKIVAFPWFNFDWRPAKEPYDIGI